MHDLTGFQRDLLYIIAGLNDPDGVAIQNELVVYYDGELTPGRLYADLNTLVEYGLVEKGRQNSHTNWYALTQRGEREIDDRQEWETQVLTEPVEE